MAQTAHRQLFIQKAILVITLFLATVLPAFASFHVRHVVIAHDVEPGYVIASLPFWGQTYSLDTSSSQHIDLSRYFMILSTGDLVTSSSISSLVGKKISLVVWSQFGSDHWQDVVRVDVRHRDKIVAFSQQRYDGIVFENMPVGTVVSGLEDLRLIKSGNMPVHYKLVSGALDQFQLVPSASDPIQIVTKQVLDHEQVKKWHLQLEARSEDPSIDPVYAKIRISVLDQNDNAPTFQKDFYHATIKDSLPTDSVILQLAASDPDGGLVRYSMYPHEVFKVDPFSGDVILKARSRLLPKTYVIQVFAEDSMGQKSKPANIQIDVNDNLYYETHAGRHHHDRRTRWRRDTLTVKEVEVMESMVGKIVDLPNNVHERFMFKSPAPDMLEIDTITGTIRLKQDKHLDYETQPEIDFSVRITRDDNAAYERIQPVKIRLIDVNDEIPQFINLPRPFLATVSPNAGPANFVYQLIAQDDDADSLLQFNLESGGEDRFEVDPETGVVRTKGRTPFRLGKEYEIGVSVEDINAPTLQKSMTYSLKILVGERDPQFYETQYKASVPETAPEGFEIIQIQAKSHQDYPITFELSTESGAQSSDFAIDSETGVVDLLQELDYEKDPAQYHLRVMAIENGRPSRTSTVSLIIDLVDMNDNSPTFPLSQYIVLGIAETVQIGADIMQVTATDVDSVTNSQLTYSVSDGNFTVQTFNNIGYIRTHRRLDYDAIPSHTYNFTVVATDNGSPAHSGSAMIRVSVSNVNDEDPQFMQGVEHVQVSEDADPNTVVHVIQAYDPDGDRITYSFTGNRLLEGPFSINPESGIITLIGQLDKNRVSYKLNITATDDGSCCGSTTSRSSTGLVVVEVKDVNNNAPRFPQCSTYRPEVDEKKNVGTQVIRVLAVDPDTGDNGNVTYSIVKSSDQSSDNFFIEPNTGILRTADMFDREGQIGVTDFGVTIKAEDQGNPKLAGFCTFRVKIGDINDNPPVFNLPVYTTSIEENSMVGKKVKQVYAMDQDAGVNGDVEYFIRSDPSGFFTIDQHSGWVSVARPMTGRDFVQLEIEARDRGSPPKSSTVKMDIEITQMMNAYPQWVEDYSSRPVRISENVPVNYIVARLKATSSMPNSDVNYFIQNGETPEQNGPPRSFYQRIDEKTNEMVLMTYRTLDYETIPRYILTIKAANRAANSLHNDTRLIIELQDENDEIPQFIGMDENGRYPGSVAENLDPGADVITVTATDRDEFEDFRKITYRIKKKDSDFRSFTIDRQTGLIRTTRTFDREKKSDYYITVIAEDGAKSDRPNHYPPGTPNIGEAEVQIRITDKNDNSPYFKKAAYYAEVTENADVGSLVLLVTAEDEDEGNTLSYSISGGNVGNAFEVQSGLGEIKVRGHLDFDLGIREYELTYRVFDDKFANTTKVYIKVLDVNDNPPRFDHAIYNVTDINEEEPGISRNNPKYLLTVRATDPDTDRDSNLKYSLTGQFADDGTVMINEYTGEIYLTRKLDRDKPWGRPVWNFNVLAHDEVGSGQSLTGYAEVRVMPRDINDNAPVFDRSRLKGSIPENSDGGRPVLTVIADDKDNGSNGTVTYSLRQVPMHGSTPLFSIESNSGLITTTVSDSLDRETQEEYKIIVVAKDRGPEPKSSTATVTIIVTDVNDHKPRFTQKVYHATMSENYAVGQSVTSVSATDDDIGSNAALTYSLKEADRKFFHMVTVQATNTGVLKVFRPVDYDTLLRPIFNLTVFVNDPLQDGTHEDVAYVEVRVTDYNDNPPAFQPPTHQVRVFENVKVGTSLARFKATDRDTGDNKKFHYAIDRTTDPDRQFSIDSNGLVTTAKMLDREKEQTHRIYILAIDHGVPVQTGVGTLIVNLMDINDNFPVFAEDYRPVIYENEPPGRTVAIISAIDKDTATNGPPFEMWLPCGGGCPCRDNPVCSLFDFKFESGRGKSGYGIGTIRSLKTFDREERKEYYLPIIMRDSGEPPMSGTNTLTIIIGDKNDNKHYPGHKDIFVYNYKGMFDDAPLGNVYAEDEDDWDVTNKTFHFVDNDWAKLFALDEMTGEIRMNGRIREGEYTFQVRVYDVVHQREVVSSVTVIFKDISDDAVFNSGSIRLSGTTAEEFVARPPRRSGSSKYGKSRYDLLRQHIAKMLGVPLNNVDIFTIMNHPTMERTIDVRYSAHGSPYYKPVKLDGIISESTQQLEEILGVKIKMTPIDECLKEKCESGGCSNVLNITGDPLLINTNGTSLIGITSFIVASCQCVARVFDTTDDITCRPDSCMNSGVCIQRKHDFVCKCSPEFDGPRCQMTRHSFHGNGWAWYKPLTQCENSHTSLEFVTTHENGIIMYNGPMRKLKPGENQDFILLELRGGYPFLQIDHGTGIAKLTMDGRDSKNQYKLRKLNDGKWHRIDIYREARIVKMVIDSCESAVINENENVQTSSEDRRPCEAISETPGENKYINVNTPLQLGGIADMRNDFVKKILPSGARPFNGCLKNFMHNGELYDLYMGEVGQHQNSEDGCPTEDVVCGVNDIHGLRCGVNGTCIGSFLEGEYSCLCKPGWRGLRCSIPTTTKDFRQRSFIEWDFKDMFYAELEKQLHKSKIQMMIRTRQPSGLLFKAQNVQKSEYLRLEIIKSRVRFRYNLGSGENQVYLAHVNVSDGQWHTVQVTRIGQWVTLTVDGGEGRFFNETHGNSVDHRHIRLSQRSLFAGGDVRFPSSNSPPLVDYDFQDSCMNDVRYNDEWLPMDHSQNTESRAADLTQSDNLEDGCHSEACLYGVHCRVPLICYDLWRYAECGCPHGQELVGPPEMCANINECIHNPCHYGQCIDHEYGFSCTCEPGYGGELCASPQQANIAYISTGFILAIVICALVLLLIIVIFIVYTRRRRPESYTVGVDPDDDVRENIIHYDEEGVGEEDQEAYDINRLKKPADDTLKKPIPITELPKDKPKKHPAYKPGERPDVGKFINDRLDEADNDPNAPPHDSVREYAYEGGGSVAGSLSSLASTSDLADQNYDYLNDWGPRFSKLADLYGDNTEKS